MGSSTCKKSLYFNKTILFCPAIGGPGPPGPPCLRQWGWSKNWGLEPLSPIASAATDGLRPGLGCGLGIQRFTVCDRYSIKIIRPKIITGGKSNLTEGRIAVHCAYQSVTCICMELKTLSKQNETWSRQTWFAKQAHSRNVVVIKRKSGHIQHHFCKSVQLIKFVV